MDDFEIRKWFKKQYIEESINSDQRQQKGLDPLDENLFDTSKPSASHIKNQNSLEYEKKVVLDSLYREGQMYVNTNMLTHEMLDKLIEWIEDIKMTDF